MPAKPTEIFSETIHTYYEYNGGLECPLCFSKLRHEFNNGGRKIVTLKGTLWVVTNYYSCTNSSCDLHQAFPAAYHSAMQRKRFSLDVWAKVIQHHFKHHLNYSLTAELMWDDWDVSISRGTVRSICEYFEMAGKQYMNKEVVKDIQMNQRIVLSLDGAQPVKGEPALWVFSDRVTGHVLLARNLDTAPAHVLCKLFKEIEQLYNAPIVSIISDKQKNIVNAAKRFNPAVPHAFCHYHFLNHVLEPISAKDRQLKKHLRRAVRKLSIVQNSRNAEINELYNLFLPVSEELKCAIAVKGNRFDVFAGSEIFANLKYVISELQQFLNWNLTVKVNRTLTLLNDMLSRILEKNRPLYNEINSLVPDFIEIREILGKRDKKSLEIKKGIESWVEKLEDRLKERNLEYDPNKIKWKQPTSKLTCGEVWQEWVRLVNSYYDGLFVAYDHKELDFTNNAKEQLFGRSKHHFRALLGRENVARVFNKHGGLYTQLLDIDYSRENVSHVLLACETPLTETQRSDFFAQYATFRRKWKIRQESTGNLDRFKEQLNTYRR
ncbi:MAG: hypothetical protein ACW963_08980 [Candidatus Sifarchaeia archaeon]|jgi:hypothetical protein